MNTSAVDTIQVNMLSLTYLINKLNNPHFHFMERDGWFSGHLDAADFTW